MCRAGGFEFFWLANEFSMSAAFAAPKAGMEKNEAIARILAEMSSDGYKQDTGEEEARELKARVEATKVTQEIRLRVQTLVQASNNKRKSRICAVFDFDMFYAAVELLTRPDLEDKPVAISGGNGDTIVTTANYVARQYGVRSAMPLFMAKQLCKRAAEFGKEPAALVVLSQNKAKQQELSEIAMAIFRSYDATMVSNSPDEAKLELGPYLQKTCGKSSFSMAEMVVEEIRSKVFAATGLTASAGIGSNFLVAKAASDFNKPNGVCCVRDDAIASFLASLPVRKIGGIGGKTEAKLRIAFGVSTCGELRAKLPEIFAVGFEAEKLLRLSIGWCDKVNKPPAPQKSMSQSRTFKPTTDRIELSTILHQLCEQLGAQMESARVFAQTASLRCETSGYVPFTKTTSFKNARSASDLKVALTPLLPESTLVLRMMSVSVTRLQSVPKRTLDHFLTQRAAV
jgi:DNA polymerase kappa